MSTNRDLIGSVQSTDLSKNIFHVFDIFDSTVTKLENAKLEKPDEKIMNHLRKRVLRSTADFETEFNKWSENFNSLRDDLVSELKALPLYTCTGKKFQPFRIFLKKFLP